MKFLLLVIKLAAAASASQQLLHFQTSNPSDAASVVAPMAPLKMATTNDLPVANAYIVRLKEVDAGTGKFTDEADAVSMRTANLDQHVHWLNSTMMSVNTVDNPEVRSEVNFVYDFGTFQGYAGTFAPAVLSAIRLNPQVATVQQDVAVKLNWTKSRPTPAGSAHGDSVTQRNATWGLQRISHAGKLPANSDPLQLDYQFDQFDYSNSADGRGVDVYLIDSGIDITHPELVGRAVWGTTVPPQTSDRDVEGHGTHVAGTVGSPSYGIARQARLIAVKVINDEGVGQFSWIFRGVEYVAKAAHRRRATRKSIAVISLSGSLNAGMNSVVDGASFMGVAVVVAAGNNDYNACGYSPGSANWAITVAATDIDDQLASFSNWGHCVSILAPGKDIISTYPGGGVLAGTSTSMAGAHAAGVAASIYSTLPANATVGDLKAAMAALAERNALGGVVTSPNRLVRVPAAA